MEIDLPEDGKLTELQKFQAFNHLIMMLYQHAYLDVMPFWFAGSSGDEYSSENFHIGFQNKKYSSDICLNERDGKYFIWFYVFDLDPKIQYIYNKEYPLEIIDDAEKLKEITTIINKLHSGDTKHDV